ncbi:hypothetical protein [Streptomyces sp. NBC_00140]|uniref:hypothetical protein n=1 Tax=Streptomyces sp. NBC_00140 TaxID=2975664 RepID=UPI00224E7E24|nr:hypothetical protein [Streptomyces sp. NBC_00140]MCX5328855.1 hypothetical protein [Streptomyces sp. NBC_00140]
MTRSLPSRRTPPPPPTPKPRDRPELLRASALFTAPGDARTALPAAHDELTEKFGALPLFHFQRPGEARHAPPARRRPP